MESWADRDIFRERLRGLINERQIPLNKIGKSILSARSLENYLAGMNMPGADSLQQIAMYFGVSCDYLLGLSSIKELPAQWLVAKNGNCICSKCRRTGKVDFMFCPHCGAAMNVSQKGEGIDA